MSEAQQSFVRGVAKFAAGLLAAKAGLDAADATTLQVAVEALAAGAIGLVAFWASYRKHAD